MPQQFVPPRVHPAFRVVVASLVCVLAISSCSSDQIQSGLPTGIDASGIAPKELVGFLREAGCQPHTGLPQFGTIGFPTAKGREMFTCKGVTGTAMRSALGRYRAALVGDPRFASATGGYTIRHYLGSREFCDQEVTTWYYNGRVTGKQTITLWGTCITIADYWDEWVPSEADEPIPEDPGSPGGPSPIYYGPNAGPERWPQMDTMPDIDEHLCDTRLDFACHQPLDSVSRARIYDTLSLHIRPLSEIPEPLRAECDSVRRWFNRALETKIIFRGATDAFAPGSDEHFGQTPVLGSYLNPSELHIDPRVLDNAKKQWGKLFLYVALWHEIAHAVGGKDHAPGAAHAATDYAGDPFFETIESGICFKIPVMN